MRKIRAVEITALYDCPGSYTIQTDVTAIREPKNYSSLIVTHYME